jgi:hypothetical protein
MDDLAINDVQRDGFHVVKGIEGRDQAQSRLTVDY